MPGASNSIKGQREPVSFSIDINLLPLLRQYCRNHDRNLSDAANLAIKYLLAIEKSKSPDFWDEQYDKLEE